MVLYLPCCLPLALRLVQPHGELLPVQVDNSGQARKLFLEFKGEVSVNWAVLALLETSRMFLFTNGNFLVHRSVLSLLVACTDSGVYSTSVPRI